MFAHAGAARFAHNWGLARVKAVIDQRAAERSYGMPQDRLTEPAVVVVARAAKSLECREGRRGSVVAGVFQGGVQHRFGCTRSRAEGLVRFAVGPT
uniref:hypothetical protein n=1 Tax=Paractinoplanes polyasparticus TaxID=2856853 RepID=UPI0034DACA8B